MEVYEIADYKEAAKYIEENETDYKVFVYKGFECEIRRTVALGHLCGYIKSPTSAIIQSAEKNFHCGITWEQDNEIGFDCAHLNDMSPGRVELEEKHYPHWLKQEDPVWRERYKTMHYVERNLKETIDNAKE
ncbi:hypothetical protein ACFOU0_12365 [Salinicoccus sesuvii]|uniref:Phage protein n=1 Tax=Salinicoccus sesuvii TaxID=868281 RepID=A0ABV7N8E8_9STAP